MTTVTIKGQVTIPKNIRKKFGIIRGTQINFIEKNNEIIIKPETLHNPFEKWVGYIKNSQSTNEIMKDMRGHYE